MLRNMYKISAHSKLSHGGQALSFDILRKAKGVEILCALLDGGMGVREIREAVGGSNTTIKQRLKELQEDDLIKEEFFATRPKRLIKLTVKGKNLAKSWVESGFIRKPMLRKLREKWILLLLHFFKDIHGRTRLMKLLFLLKNEGGFRERNFHKFKPYLYGPFSKEVILDLEELQDRKFIELEYRQLPKDEFGEKAGTYVYRLTPKGESLVTELLEHVSSDVIRKINKLKRFNRMRLSTLLEYVYKRYPTYTTNSEIGEKVLHNH